MKGDTFDDLRESIRAELASVREAPSSDDSHFYGAWKSGGSVSGSAMAKAAATARRRDRRTEQRNATKGVKSVSPDEAIEALRKGQRPSVEPQDVRATMEKMAQGEILDLTELQVAGTMKFGGDGLGLPRSQMPQIESIADFADSLREAGVSSTTVRVNPADMKPMQKEVNSVKTAQMYLAMREGTMKEGPIVITKDGYVLDGHHRWGAATALSFERETSIPAIQIGMDAKPLYDFAMKWTADRGIRTRGLNEARRG